MMAVGEQAAAVWKNSWLPFSETFVRDQIAFLPEWEILKIGFDNLSAGLLRADYAPYSPTLSGKVSRKIFGVRPYLNEYIDFLNRSRSRLIHAHFGSGGINALPLAKATGLPLITTFHGSDTTFYGSKVPGVERWYQSSLRDLFENSAMILAASRYLADRLVSAGAPAGKIEVHYTGTRCIDLQETEQERSGIVFVGRLIPIKGVAHLLQAVASLGEPYAQDTPVTIVGDGPLRGELELLARRLQVNAKFLGRLPSSDIPHVLARHEIFCAPSLPSALCTREGFGMVYLEAALQELPAVAYLSGGVGESVANGKTGILVSEGDVAGLSKALRQLLQDKDLRTRLGRAGRLRALSQFDIVTQSARLADIYTSVS